MQWDCSGILDCNGSIARIAYTISYRGEEARGPRSCRLGITAGLGTGEAGTGTFSGQDRLVGAVAREGRTDLNG